MDLKESVRLHAKAGFGGIWITTDEQEEAQRTLNALKAEEGWDMHTWSPARDEMLPQFLKSLPLTEDAECRTLVVLHNPEEYLTGSPEVAQITLNAIEYCKPRKANLVVISAVFNCPPMLVRSFSVLEHSLPSKDDLAGIMEGLEFGVEVSDPAAVIDAASGLTRMEAENAFALSFIANERRDVLAKDVWQLKAKELKKTGTLELYEGEASFERLCGLDALKDFCVRSAGKREAKGVLLLGVPGAGKSEFAKALGNEVGLPTVTVDFGSMMGSLVGQTEERLRRALKSVDAMAPCILFADEIEKALSGAGGANDSGVSQRMLGTLLTWLNDRTSAVYFIGTCNNIEQLSTVSAGAFTRAERFDGIFYIGLPDKTQRQAMWELYRRVFDVPLNGNGAVDDTGWTGAEIKSCCRLSSLLGISIAEASQLVVPVSRTATAQINSLEEWANNRALDANAKGIYKKPSSQMRRAI